MSDTQASGAPPVRFGGTVFAEVRDPNGLNPKVRCVVVLTPHAALVVGYAAGEPGGLDWCLGYQTDNGRGNGHGRHSQQGLVVPRHGHGCQ
jgi:hypothetical protein